MPAGPAPMTAKSTVSVSRASASPDVLRSMGAPYSTKAPELTPGRFDRMLAG